MNKALEQGRVRPRSQDTWREGRGKGDVGRTEFGVRDAAAKSVANRPLEFGKRENWVRERHWAGEFFELGNE